MIKLYSVAECVSDFACPHCCIPIEVEFDNEYGYPEIGSKDCSCPECGKAIRVETNLDFTVSKRS